MQSSAAAPRELSPDGRPRFHGGRAGRQRHDAGRVHVRGVRRDDDQRQQRERVPVHRARGHGAGLYYYRARYYHPTLQRFISEDPIGFAAGDVNLYAYVGNRPSIVRDPLGLSEDTYEPDLKKHGKPHIDRYDKHGRNVGRYNPDGSSVDFKAKPSPRIPNADQARFSKAAAKLTKLMKAAGLIGLLIGIFTDTSEAGGLDDECNYGPGTCGQRLIGMSTDFPVEPPCISGRKGQC
jgi:RHS repeat-associated protein